MAPKRPANGAYTDSSVPRTEHDHMLSNNGDSEETKPRWRGIMGGQYLDIFLASISLIVPMLALSAVLLGLVYTHLMPNNASTYSDGNSTGIELGQAYYVNYSATRLVFIASVSSTLSTVLITAAMVLVSYPIAHDLAVKSDEDAVSKLPSPYQLSLIIKALDGKPQALWSILSYALGSKRRRVGLVPNLWKAVAMLAGLVLLAILITLADTWLHVSTTSVQYLELRPDTAPPNLTPGRSLPPTCITNATHALGPGGTGCVLQPAGSGGGGGLYNQTEYVKTADNQSDINQVYVIDGQAVLGQSNPTLDYEFQADSFASHTTCEMVTQRCGTHAIDPGGSDAARDTEYNCNVTNAGLKLSGNFSDLTNIQEGGDSTTSKSAGNTISSTYDTATYGFGFQYFNDAAKTNQSKTLGPQDPHTPHLYWAVVFTLGSGWNVGDEAGTGSNGYNEGTFDNVGLAGQPGGGLGGILSCTTDLSSVTYAFANSTHRILNSTLMDPNTALPFVAAISGSFGTEQLHRGIQAAAASALSPEDLATSFASAYDQTVMALPAGVLLSQPPRSVTKRESTLVTRVPKAPFLALVLLDLLYAFIGIVLAVTALLVSLIGKSGVRDAQARLGLAALVAESFESPALGDDARDVSKLFAERRGMPTRRVALGKREGGGRKYRLVLGRRDGGE